MNNENKIRGAGDKGKSVSLVRQEHMKDACGVGLIASIDVLPSHDIVLKGLEILRNLEHRGAIGADEKAGDGAGILIQLPHELFCKHFAKSGQKLPQSGDYAVSQMFMPKRDEIRQKLCEVIEKVTQKCGYEILGWRAPPVDDAHLGWSVRPNEPCHRQFFIKKPPSIKAGKQFERKLFLLRHEIKNALEKNPIFDGKLKDLYTCSMSSLTIIYKGIILGNSLHRYFTDLADPDCKSGFAIVHQRYSTNTLPSWRLGHPYRLLAHNGEINTIRGNINWMRARENSLSCPVYGDDVKKLLPISDERQSDSAVLDNTLEFMVNGCYELDEALMIMVPEPLSDEWQNSHKVQCDMQDFFRFNSSVLEPWDGPAALVATDGSKICIRLDRNALRPLRYCITKDRLLILASEAGVIKVEPRNIVKLDRLCAGQMLMLDIDKKRIIDDDIIRKNILNKQPYKQWLRKSRLTVSDLPKVQGETDSDVAEQQLPLRIKQSAFGYSQEELRIILKPMAQEAQEPTGAMGVDTALAVLSNETKLLTDYFKQKFAQVTNPPIDPLRETLVMSLMTLLGKKANFFLADCPDKEHHIGRCLELPSPILTPSLRQKIGVCQAEGGFLGLRAVVIDTTIAVHQDIDFDSALERICDKAQKHVLKGDNILILSDIATSRQRIALPALLCVAAVHYRLVRKGLRLRAGLVIETAEARQVHHMCVLAGYGAEAIYPYLAFHSIEKMTDDTSFNVSKALAIDNYRKALDKGILKVMSKMGVSVFQSYCGAQIFDIIGLDYQLCAKWFPYTANALGGIAMGEIERQTRQRFARAMAKKNSASIIDLDIGGEYALRQRGEPHAWTLDTIATLQHSVRGNIASKYREFADKINNNDSANINLRSLMQIKVADQCGRKRLSLEKVEPAVNIVRRFSTGAMSFGSISREAHENLAIAMNSMMAKSNTGEGGEERRRLFAKGLKNNSRSAIKQVASGRFGVTTEYLVNADMIQIKMAQGAKPGEGGQLPGIKIDEIIASVRYSTPGVTLISPPPHHDIYSIEDLAQLIFDIKNVNPLAAVSVKLVALDGVGTVATGVVKGYADHVTISGYEGGTGASPLTSIRHAGMPWEVNLAETQQALVLNGLRGRVCLQVDGGLRTGKDVVIAALLGADEMGFATAPLIASGCLMMRKCHLNICPVGIATQDPVLRKRFAGKPEHVINYFFFVAEEVRNYMASMGFETFNEMIGQGQFLASKSDIKDEKAKTINLEPLFAKVENPFGTAIYNRDKQPDIVADVMDKKIINDCKYDLQKNIAIEKNYRISNKNRSVGAMLSGYIIENYGDRQMPCDSVRLNFQGVTGQSFGAFLTKGVTLNLVGASNDYLGKGLCGGRIIVRHHDDCAFDKGESCIAGNTVLYGATGGDAYLAGQAGERFAVRNSGGVAVVEGLGDHGCEYMTGGVVMVLGKVGRNFAAGMSGGIAYVYDEKAALSRNCNRDMVRLLSISRSRAKSDSDCDKKLLLDKKFMLQFDEQRILMLLRLHYNYTGSSKAKRLLSDRSAVLRYFVKVLPIDFEKILLTLTTESRADVAQQPA